MNFDAFLSADGLIALVTLTVLEVVLGIDNVIFISILAGKLPKQLQDRARRIGLMAAMGMRILLLMSIAWMSRLTSALFSIGEHPVSGRDLILFIGGLFLLFKSTREIHDKLEGEEGHVTARVAPTLAAVVTQIMLLDIVFSLDSVITAVGMVDRIEIMITAVVLAMGVMLAAAGSIAGFVERHPTVKMLALAFLLLIGTTLIAEGVDQHIPKGYIYFAMAFSLFVEVLNLRAQKARASEPVHLREPYTGPQG